MNKEMYHQINSYMHSCMKDSAHDCQHIYRVLYHSLDISEAYEVDEDVLITAALLHDIGREAQYKDHRIDHAVEGSQMAYEYLTQQGWSEEKAALVKDCIKTHRFRSNNPPKTIEAKILFDADKLDVTGGIGIARTIAYKGVVAQPMYSVNDEGLVMTGKGKEVPSFFREYHFKLKKIYDRFYTEEARNMAKGREATAREFYEKMYKEMHETHSRGVEILNRLTLE